MLLNYTDLKEMQMKYLDDDTFNFLVELRVVSIGQYNFLINIAATDTKRAAEVVKECKHYWGKWLVNFNPNVFQIAYCARKGYLTPMPID